jgi:hypothetical protein
MLNSILCALLMFSTAMQFGSTDVFKREKNSLQNDVDAVINSTGASLPSRGDNSKASYLDGYGVVVVLEVVLEPPPNPFSSPKTSEQVKKVVAQRLQQIQEKVSDWLKARVTTTESVGASDALAVIVHFVNTTPADVPNLPSQVVISVKKAAPTQVTIREF